MTARVCHHNDQPWIVVEAASHIQGAEPIVIYDGPLNLSSKRVIRDEIDWVNQQTGVARPDLYDAIRLYQASKRREVQHA